MKAKPQVFTRRNIAGGWRGSGLSPLNSVKVLEHLTDSESQSLSAPVTPPNGHVDLDILNKLQTTLTVFNLQQFTRQLADLAIQNAINSLWRQAIPKLMQQTEKVLTALSKSFSAVNT